MVLILFTSRSFHRQSPTILAIGYIVHKGVSVQQFKIVFIIQHLPEFRVAERLNCNFTKGIHYRNLKSNSLTTSINGFVQNVTDVGTKKNQNQRKTTCHRAGIKFVTLCGQT